MADLTGAPVISSPAAVAERPRTGPASAPAPQKSSAPTSICEFLEWDSKFFGIRIARVTGHRLDGDRTAEIALTVHDQSIDCLYFLADQEKETIQLAELQGFQLINVRVTLAARLLNMYAGTWNDDGIREAVPADIPALREIAGRSYNDSRFYQDGRFPVFLCDEMYRGWIEKSCHGYADIVLVAEQDAQPAGYICCHLKDDGSGQIGLMGATGGMKNQAVVRQLVHHALCWFQEREVRDVTVVASGSNITAQRLYQRSGFLTRGMQLWYHLWPSGRETAAS
ncbi:MAG TPA: GNAT family N-acetyltransferase [Bryobacteraceae bacterium]|nr:GNAT family N-acetyltransferase [Bryobacteraceae bacterium]